MTINSEVRVAGPFQGNDVAVDFPFTFKVFAADEVLVVREEAGVELVLELNVDYTVALNADQEAAPGGAVTLLAGPLSSDETLTLTSALAPLQPVDLTNQGGFYPRVINTALDRLTILIQQLSERLSRTLVVPISEGETGFTIPGVGERKGTVLAFNEATGAPQVGPQIGAINTVAANTAAINTVANNIGDVNTVAANVTDVTNFADVYYGSSANDPTTRRDGTPLQVGDLYFNTSIDALRSYNGTAWRGIPNGAITVQNLSGDGIETEFLLNYAPDNKEVTSVFISGVYQQKNTYELGGAGGAWLIFDEAPPVGAGNIEVVVSSLQPSDDKLRQELASAGGAEIVGHNLETVAAALDRAGESNTHAFGNVKRNEYDYATLQASITPPISEWTRTNFDAAGAHAAGTVGVLSAACSGQAFSHYLLKVVITTTTPGRVKILQGGADIIGDQPNGIVFSNAAILNKAIENNRYVDNNTYYFVVVTSGTGFANFSFETDTSWAGTISEVALQPVNATKFAFAGASELAPGLNGPVGLKVGAYNRGDMALGDKYTLGVMQYDGNLPTPAYNVAIGAGALATNFKGDENTAVGTWALRFSEGSNNVAMGYSAAKMTTKGQELVAIGYKAMVDNTTGFRNTAVGFWASGLNNTGKEITALGWYAGRNATGGDNNTYIGARSGQANIRGSYNTYVGALAGYGTGSASTTFDYQLIAGSESQGYGHQAVALGFQARVGTSSVASEGGVAVGRGATVSGVGIGSIAIGRGASAGSSTPATAVGDAAVATGERSVALGQTAQATAEQSVSVGGLSEAKGQYNTSIGAQAGRNNTGASNTFVGRLAGNAATNTFSNCSLLGANTAVTANNQVQLGDSQTTTYVYGTVQNRSDFRDKADIADTALGIDFIMGLRPVHGRWDMREDYRVVNDDGTVTVFEKDGSKKRNRLHQWFIAQEVAELCTSLGVEFGGLQHHAVNGGEDVFSLGYDEFIPPVVKAVQECWSRLDAMEARLAALESM